nr:nicotinate phosphoribosyltransferase [Candidatus Njordarchaeum guaymaensis]
MVRKERLFYYADDDEIRKGDTADIYLFRTKEILEKKGLGDKKVVVEVTTGALPNNANWGVLCGVGEVARLLEGLPIDVYCMWEGTVFHARDCSGIRAPVMVVEGAFSEFVLYDTSMLGLICQSSGIATRTARLRKIIGRNKFLLSFGIRRMHPAIAPLIDYAAYVGTADGVSGVAGGKLIGIEPSGTIPHTLILLFYDAFGSQAEAWKAFDEIMSPEVPRVVLCDTLYDEKIESLMAAEVLGKRLSMVRLDTVGSRRGNMPDIVREVRRELEIRGHNHVKIMVSGGLNEESVKELAQLADGFGVGTYISNSPTVDLSFDIVEIEGKPIAKRGKVSGKKQVFRCMKCYIDLAISFDANPTCPVCGAKMEPLLQPLIKNGRIVRKQPTPREIREYVLKQLEKVTL